MKKSRKLEVYELHNGAFILCCCKVGKKGGFVQMRIGKALSGHKTDAELGKLVREYMQNSEWSDK